MKSQYPIFNNGYTSPGQKINKETEDLNSITEQMGVTDIYRTFHPIAVEYTCSASTHGMLFRTEHMLGYEASVYKFKRLKSHQASFLTTTV